MLQYKTDHRYTETKTSQTAYISLIYKVLTIAVNSACVFDIYDDDCRVSCITQNSKRVKLLCV